MPDSTHATTTTHATNRGQFLKSSSLFQEQKAAPPCVQYVLRSLRQESVLTRTSILDIGECKAALSAPVLGFLFCRWAPVPISTDRGEGDRYPLPSQQCQAHMQVMYGLIQWLWLFVHGGSGSDKAEIAGAYPKIKLATCWLKIFNDSLKKSHKLQKMDLYVSQKAIMCPYFLRILPKIMLMRKCKKKFIRHSPFMHFLRTETCGERR